MPIGNGIGIGFSSSGSSWPPRYYVSNTGDDSKDGRSPLNAWRTIAKVNGTSFVPGDKIGFAKDGVWRETLTVPTSGDVNNPITFGAYGAGSLLPIFDGSDIITIWSADTGSEDIGGKLTDTGSGAGGNYICCEPITSGSAGVVGSYSFYLGAIGTSTMTKLKMALYTNNAGAPGSLVANSTSQEVTSFTWSGWNTITLASGPTVATATSYWLAIWANGTITNSPAKVLGAGGLSRGYKNYPYATNSGVFPDPLAGSVDTKYSYGMYYTVSAAGVANVYNASVTATPLQVFRDAVRSTKGASKATLNDHEWFAVGTTLSYRDDSGTPQGAAYAIAALVRNNNVLITGKNYNTINNINCKYGNTNGIYITNYNGITINGCNVSFSSNAGIQTDTTGTHTNCILKYNTCVYNGFVGSDGIRAGIDIKGGDIAEHNILHDNVIGLECDQQGTGNTVRYNQIYSNTYMGIEANNTDSNLIYNNLVFNNGVGTGGGIHLFDSSNGTCTDNKIYNNTFYNNLQKNILIESEQTNLSILNNIFYKSNANANIWLFSGKTYAGINVDYNSYYKTDAGAYWDLHQWQYSTDGNGPQTFAQWQALGFDAHGIIADPLLVDPVTSDFHLQVGSPCINAGVDVGLTEDYEGNAIVGVPDIGAYEKQ